ncbi:MAG TPA: hypothetical protein VH165_21640 [Kofleriaceae bacterium]|jgi:hypothetical protein|nr:hypothetical protein [Kofleriaceae bacterium]
MSTEPREPQPIGAQIEQAFDYRGYVTLSRRDGSQLVGFVYDRGPAYVELFDEAASQRIRVAVDDIASIELTGEDSAAKAQKIWERRKGALEPPETSAWGDWEDREDRPVLLLVALPGELRSVADVIGARRHGAVARGRVGSVSAVGLAVGMGGGAAHVIAAEHPRLVISCGLSGALDPSLATGDWVLASSVCDDDGESIAVSEPILRAARRELVTGGGPARLAEGEILCATQVAATAAEKRALARPGRLAIDLESGPAARAAHRAGIPWLGLRVILDPLDLELPAFTRQPHPSYIVPALRHALGGPRATAELARLGLRARTAHRSLAQALCRLAPMFGPRFTPASGPTLGPTSGPTSGGIAPVEHAS